MTDNDVMADLLEHLESMALTEGQYLKFCTLLKEVNQKKDSIDFIPLNCEVTIDGPHYDSRFVFNWGRNIPHKPNIVNITRYSHVKGTDTQHESKTLGIHEFHSYISGYAIMIQAKEIKVNINGSEFVHDYDTWLPTAVKDRKAQTEAFELVNPEVDVDCGDIWVHSFIEEILSGVKRYVQGILCSL